MNHELSQSEPVMMTQRKRVHQMSAAEAFEARYTLDHVPASQLPGAEDIGPERAREAYALFRSLLTQRINEAHPIEKALLLVRELGRDAGLTEDAIMDREIRLTGYMTEAIGEAARKQVAQQAGE